MKTFLPNRFSRPSRGFTLVEMMIAGLVMATLFGGLLRIVVQSRRITEGSVTQNGVTLWIQGYVDQMKSIEYNQIPVSPAAAPTAVLPSPAIATFSDLNVSDPVLVSWGEPPGDFGAAGVTPTRGIGNRRTLEFKNPPVRVALWVWVQESTDPLTQASTAKAITIVYDYEMVDGTRTRTWRGTLRTIRSALPKY